MNKASKYCPKCKVIYPPKNREDKYCFMDGTKLLDVTDAPTCPHCGTEILHIYHFCPECGAKIERE